MPEPRRLLVLDDDPTGSQAISDVDVAFNPDPVLAARILSEPGSTCFVLTNSRSLDEADAVALSRRIVSDVVGRLSGAGDNTREGEADARRSSVGPTGLHVVSRSDSTLRGHVIAEPNAIADALAGHGIDVDAFVFCPAMIEAGRLTEDTVHRARVRGELVPVASTDFARDATFGYAHSDLREFLEERSGGAVKASDCLVLSLADIRHGGVERVRSLLEGARSRQWVIVNATEYSDMNVVAEAMAQLEAAGRVFVSRCGPSFVRALAGRDGSVVIGPGEAERTVRDGHGIIIVGSHVGLTSTQLERLRDDATASGVPLAEFELNVPALLDPESREEHLSTVTAAAREALAGSDVLVSTSRDVITATSEAESLAIARAVSDAVVALTRGIRPARPGWVIAKGGITSHEVAASGLGIRRARVKGQFFPGQISMTIATDAPADVTGLPYIIFPGNVGGPDALAQVAARMRCAGGEPSGTGPADGTPGTTEEESAS